MSTRNLLVLSITFLLALTSINVKAQNQTPPDGSSSNPYPIKNKAALESLRTRMNSGSDFYFNPADSMFVTTSPGNSAPNLKNTFKYYKLLSDIDLNPGENVSACDGDATGLTQWVPFNSFKGHLDGGYHIISGVLVIELNADNKVGFVRELPENASIKNLGIVNSYISGKNRVGGLVG